MNICEYDFWIWRFGFDGLCGLYRLCLGFRGV
jgi:hypothetical protein